MSLHYIWRKFLPKYSVHVSLMILCLFTVSHAQNLRFNHFDTHNGLSQNNVNSLLADSSGYIWIGTIEGLTRFDGREFKIYRPFPGNEKAIHGNIVNHMACSPGGNLWVLTSNGGLNLYDALRERFYFYPDSLFKNIPLGQISGMVSPNDNFVYFSVNNWIFKFDSDSKKVSVVYTSTSVCRLVGIDKQTIWIYGETGIKAMSINSRQELVFVENILTTPVRVISEVYQNNITCISNGKVIQLDLKTMRIREHLLSDFDIHLKESQIISVVNHKNEIWFGKDDGLVRVVVGEKSSSVTTFSYDPYNNTSFQGKDATRLIFDKAGNLWIGTSKYGVNLLSREENVFLHHQVSLLSKTDKAIDPVRAICLTSDGSLWTGFDRFGLVRTNNDHQILFDKIYHIHQQAIPLTGVRSLYEDSYGNLWIGSNRGLCIYNKKKKRIESVSLAFGWDWSSHCYVMKEFDKGILTITGGNGLATVDLATMKLRIIPLDEKGIKITESIRGIVRDKNNNYWITLNTKGLLKITPQLTCTHFTRETHGLTDNKLYNLTLIGNSLWIASNTGLNEFDITTEKVKSVYYESDGLSSNLTYSVVADEAFLWISTNRGLCRFNPFNRHFENFLPNDLFMDDAYYKDSEGRIYFGGYDGVISFDPKKIRPNSFLPKPGIASLHINNQEVTVGEKVGGLVLLPVSIKKINELKLNNDFHSFSLTFDAFPFTFPDRTLFRYRLKELSSEWLLTGKNENKAVFTNLDPGKYTFQLQSSLNGITWSDSTELKIEIIPPFWKTRLFRIFLLSILFLIGFFSFQYRIYAIKRRNILLQQKVEQQTKSIEEQKNKIIAQKDQMVELSERLHEADQAKLSFYTNISHEFRTPLTLILGNADTLVKQGFSNFAIKSILKNAERLLSLVNQFLDLRKNDDGKLKLSVSEFDIVSFTSEIAIAFREMADRKKITIHLMNDDQPVLLWLDKEKTDKILYNILSNAIKYTEPGGSIIIDFQKEAEGLKVMVSDTGYGIPKEDLPYIFENFFRGKNYPLNIEGHGIGLALVKVLMDLQKATITTESEVGKGTTFTLLFKWGKEHFDPQDFTKTEFPVLINKEQQVITAPILNISNPAGEEILIVEDNEEVMNYLISLLGPYFHIKQAANGKQALALLSGYTPDLILTDLMMPEMNGMEFCKTLKEKNNTMFIPVIILSAKTDVSSKIEGLKINVDDYIEKPFHPDILVLKISNLLKKRHDMRQKLENFFPPSVPSKSLTRADKQFLEKALTLLEDNLSDPHFSIDTLSSGLCMSRITFHRKMKEITGEGPGEFIRKYRLKKAAQMLRYERKTISQVCTEVGFQSASHFRQSFKEEFGVLPSEYVLMG